MDDFPQRLKKVVRIVLYRPAISQSDCRKAGPYQLPLIIDQTHFWALLDDSLIEICYIKNSFISLKEKRSKSNGIRITTLAFSPVRPKEKSS